MPSNAATEIQPRKRSNLTFLPDRITYSKSYSLLDRLECDGQGMISRSIKEDDVGKGEYLYYRDRSKHFPCIERAEGVYLYDNEGKKYLDATGGPFVVSIGYGVPEIVEAIAEQA